MNLVERLRKAELGYDHNNSIFAEAAERIRALEAHNAVLREAHSAVVGCIDAANFEGLIERLSELQTDVGQIRDLVERRLLWAGIYSEQALASTPESSLADIRRAEKVSALYNELLYHVATKHPDETRHETALRYIKQAENRKANVSQADTRQMEDLK